MKRSLVVVVTLTAVLALAGPGRAKPGHNYHDALKSGVLTGPGIEEPIELDQRAARRSAALSGGTITVAGLQGGPLPFTEAPVVRGGLGPRYELTWFFRLPDERKDYSVVQNLYPFASGGPLIETPPGQWAPAYVFHDQQTPAFWDEVDPALLARLEKLGLPETALGSLGSARSHDPHADLVPWAFGASLVALLAGAAVISALRRRSAVA